jgi:hypothetical protein
MLQADSMSAVTAMIVNVEKLLIVQLPQIQALFSRWQPKSWTFYRHFPSEEHHSLRSKLAMEKPAKWSLSTQGASRLPTSYLWSLQWPLKT